jgi:hypothetical protein
VSGTLVQSHLVQEANLRCAVNILLQDYPQSPIDADSKPTYPGYYNAVLTDLGQLCTPGDSTAQGSEGWKPPEQEDDEALPRSKYHTFATALLPWAMTRKPLGRLKKDGSCYRPFPSKTLHKHAFYPPKYPKLYTVRLEELLEACLQKNPEDRPDLEVVEGRIDEAIKAWEKERPEIARARANELFVADRVETVPEHRNPFAVGEKAVKKRRTEQEDYLSIRPIS